MDISLYKSTLNTQLSVISITGSKSETNRLLMLQALYPNITLVNTSNSDDSQVMIKALQNFPLPAYNFPLFDAHHAGTAMRFLTAFFAIQEGNEVTLTGSFRMKERPIAILVDALNQLGAEISYEKKEGFPPIKIKGKTLTNSKISLPANVSSQYISALLLIAPKLENGLELTLVGEITSIPYIKMTLALLNKIGIETSFNDNIIAVKPKMSITNSQFIIESDWSSASYFYSIVALSPLKTKLKLTNFKENSIQGDSVLADIYLNFGVRTTYFEDVIILEKINFQHQSVKLNLIETPDLAQTIIVTAFALGLGCRIQGLETLKIKETNRLEALRIELSRFGALIFPIESGLLLAPSTRIKEHVSVKTYHDHRMAMAFAPLALKTNLIIEDAEVVSKSYPTFWEDLKQVGFEIEEFIA